MKPRPIRKEGDVAYVPLTKGLESVIDASDVHLFEGSNWQAHVTKSGTYGRRYILKDGKPVYVYIHRVIFGQIPDGHVPHHKDSNGLNNRRANLELVTSRKNSFFATRQSVRNRTAKGRSGSVRYIKRDCRWIANIYLGSFLTREEADIVRADAAATLFLNQKTKKPPASPES